MIKLSVGKLWSLFCNSEPVVNFCKNKEKKKCIIDFLTLVAISNVDLYVILPQKMKGCL